MSGLCVCVVVSGGGPMMGGGPVGFSCIMRVPLVCALPTLVACLLPRLARLGASMAGPGAAGAAGAGGMHAFFAHLGGFASAAAMGRALQGDNISKFQQMGIFGWLLVDLAINWGGWAVAAAFQVGTGWARWGGVVVGWKGGGDRCETGEVPLGAHLPAGALLMSWWPVLLLGQLGDRRSLAAMHGAAGRWWPLRRAYSSTGDASWRDPAARACVRGDGDDVSVEARGATVWLPCHLPRQYHIRDAIM